MPPNLDAICISFREKDYNIRKHGFREMGKDLVTYAELEFCMAEDEPEIIEDYPEDERGPACLVLAWSDVGQPLHICIGYRGTKPDVITVYRPDERPDLWVDGFRERA